MHEEAYKFAYDIAIFQATAVNAAFWGEKLGPENNPYRQQEAANLLSPEQARLRREKDLENGFKALGRILVNMN